MKKEIKPAKGGLSKAQLAKRKNSEPTDESGLTVKIPLEILDGLAYQMRWKYDIIDRSELRGEDLVSDDIIEFISDVLKFTCGNNWKEKPIRIQGRRKLSANESDNLSASQP